MRPQRQRPSSPATHGQLEALAAGLRPDLALTVWLMLGCGLRVSEALAVRADSFRDDGTVLRVSEQITRAGGTGPLKARRPGEYRDVPVPAWLWAKVREHIAAYGTQGYLFSSADGGHVAYGGYHARFASRACRAGLPDFGPHQLRHLFASRLLSAGVPITDVSKWLGHRDINITHNIYSHLMPSSWDRARAALESLGT